MQAAMAMEREILQRQVQEQIMSRFLLSAERKQILLDRLALFPPEQLRLLSDRLNDEGEALSYAFKQIMDRKLHDDDGPAFIEEILRIIKEGGNKLYKSEEKGEREEDEKASEQLLSQL